MVARIHQATRLAKPQLTTPPRKAAAESRNARVSRAALGADQGPIGHEIGYMPLANGASYDGETAYGRPHGFGTYQSASGDAVVGFFALGKMLVDRSRIVLPDGTAVAATRQERSVKLAAEIWQNAEEAATQNARQAQPDAEPHARMSHTVGRNGPGGQLALRGAMSRLSVKDVAMMSIIVGVQILVGETGILTGLYGETALTAALGASVGAISETFQKNRNEISGAETRVQPRESAFLWSIAGAGLSTMVYYAEAAAIGCAMTSVGTVLAAAFVHEKLRKVNGDHPKTPPGHFTLKKALLVALGAPAVLCAEVTLPITVGCLVVGAAAELGQQAVRNSGK